MISGEVLQYRKGLLIRGRYETFFTNSSPFPLTMPNGDIKFRQAYLRLRIDRIDADGSQLRITGSEDVLAAMALNSGQPDRDSVNASVTGGVPKGIRTKGSAATSVPHTKLPFRPSWLQH